jgi:uncharacterized protein DUF6788
VRAWYESGIAVIWVCGALRGEDAMPKAPATIAELEHVRDALYAELARVGDFRRGSLNAVRRRCGKPNCACAQPGHPGHGPQYNFTRSVGGRTINVHLRPGPELEQMQRAVSNYQRFVELSERIVEVNEALCDARTFSPLAEESARPPQAEKGGSSASSRRRSPRR